MRLDLGTGDLEGWRLTKAEDEAPERTLRGMLLSLVWRTTRLDDSAEKILGEDLQRYNKTRGQLLRDALLTSEGYCPVHELERVAAERCGHDATDHTNAFFQAVYLAAMAWRVYDAPEPSSEPEAKPEPQPELAPEQDQRNWGRDEWSTYLEAEVPQELVRHVFEASAQLADETEGLALAERTGQLGEIAKAQRRIEKKLGEWTKTVTRVQAVALGLAEWPCKGTRTATLQAQIRSALDAKRLAEVQCPSQ